MLTQPNRLASLRRIGPDCDESRDSAARERGLTGPLCAAESGAPSTLLVEWIRIGLLLKINLDFALQGLGVHPAVRMALQGLDSEAARPDPDSCPNRPSDEPMTARERSVLQLIGRGLSNKKIARDLNIAPETVKSHTKHIFFKLGTNTRAQAVACAAKRGLL